VARGDVQRPGTAAPHGLDRLPEAAPPGVQRARSPLEEMEVAVGRRLEELPLRRAGTTGRGRRHGGR